MDSIFFGVKGLPYTSKNFKGDPYFAARNKIRKWVTDELSLDNNSIKRIWVNMDTGYITFKVEANEKGRMLAAMIAEHPAKEFPFSWEKRIHDTKPEPHWLRQHKAIIYLHDIDRVTPTLPNTAAVMETLDFECEMDKWVLERAIDVVLSENDDMDNFIDEGVDEIESILGGLSLTDVPRKKRKCTDALVIELEDDDDEEAFFFGPPVPVTSSNKKKTWSSDEICERIRLLVASANISISNTDMKRLTFEFGEERPNTYPPHLNPDGSWPEPAPEYHHHQGAEYNRV